MINNRHHYKWQLVVAEINQARSSKDFFATRLISSAGFPTGRQQTSSYFNAVAVTVIAFNFFAEDKINAGAVAPTLFSNGRICSYFSSFLVSQDSSFYEISITDDF